MSSPSNASGTASATLSGGFAAGDSISATVNSTNITYEVIADDFTVNGNGTGGEATEQQARNNITNKLAAAIDADGDLNGVVTASANGDTITVSSVNNSDAVSLTTSVTAQPSGFSQLGSDIDGEAEGDESGYPSPPAMAAFLPSVPRSTIAVRGSTRIYAWNGTVHGVQRGSDIDGEADDDETGVAAALFSSDGNTVAMVPTVVLGVGRASSPGMARCRSTRQRHRWRIMG